jgi:1-acyl-sn-glycerol-3-phosphate acyltransferase
MKKLIARVALWLGGWRRDGDPPRDPRCVLIAFPHTSNWDFIWVLAFAWATDVHISWMGKEEMFRWPFGWFMRLLGGIPVHRKARANQVEQLVERFQRDDRLTLVVPAEGTRTWVPRWKSGFYHVARAADVPVVLSFLDYGRKVGGFGPAIRLSGDVRRDMDVIRAFYAPMRGKHHECTGTIVLAEELAESDAPQPSTGA